MAPGDRGMLVPRFVTALNETDTRGGWRPSKAKGGCLIDVPSGEIVARGLSMPHSPRSHEGRLWLLESGNGRLLLEDNTTGHRETVTEVPGFVRGLAIHGPYAFMGLSKIRESATLGGLPIGERLGEVKCGVAAVDFRSGRVVGMFEFRSAVEEIFEVQLLVGVRFPEVIGSQQDTVCRTFVVPDGGGASPPLASGSSAPGPSDHQGPGPNAHPRRMTPPPDRQGSRPARLDGDACPSAPRPPELTGFQE